MRSKVILLWGIYIFILWESGCFAVLFLLAKFKNITYSPIRADLLNNAQVQTLRALLQEENTYLKYDPDAGWTIRPNASSSSGLIHANSQGIRAQRDYSQVPDSGLIRVACFGDSFTHGDEVGDTETWQAQLEGLDHKLEVLNFGVSGYGIDQAYLRFIKQGVNYKPSVVIIGFMSENIFRSLNVFRPFYSPTTGIPMTKPRFVKVNDELKLLPNPFTSLNDYHSLLDNPAPIIASLGAHDWFFKNHYGSGAYDILPSVRLFNVLKFTYFPNDRVINTSGIYNINSEAFQVTASVLSLFYREVLAHSAKPILLFFPSRSDVEKSARGLPPTYQPLIEFLSRQKMKAVDTAEAFKLQSATADPSHFFLMGGHYSKDGNQVIAQYVFHQLEPLLSQ